VVFGKKDSTFGNQRMIIYLLWGLIFGGLFHYVMIVTQQEVVLSEIILVVLGWPLILLFFVLGLINEFRK
jgi:hypothetical protein